jgi:hypothetical protein
VLLLFRARAHSWAAVKWMDVLLRSTLPDRVPRSLPRLPAARTVAAAAMVAAPAAVRCAATFPVAAARVAMTADSCTTGWLCARPVLISSVIAAVTAAALAPVLALPAATRAPVLARPVAATPAPARAPPADNPLLCACSSHSCSTQNAKALVNSIRSAEYFLKKP